jgi:putative tricarboxylic transport membrane protein
MPEHKGSSLVSRRAMDMAVAVLLLAVGALVASDSWRIGATWASDGPRAGYFPFYIGLFLMASSAYTLIATWLDGAAKDGPSFVQRAQFKSVLQILIPAAIFIFATGYIGIYVASALYVGVFMYWLGGYSLWKLAPVSVLVPLSLFLMFEIWFLVPLPKGPLENWLGY